MHFLVALIESAIALGAFVLVYRFVSHVFRRRRGEDTDGGEPFAEVTAPLSPRTPKALCQSGRLGAP